MKDHVEIVFLLDTSGSMAPLIPETTIALNSFIEQQKRIGSNATFSLHTFNIKPHPFYGRMPIEMVQPVQSLPSGGGTALLDAVGGAIDELGDRLRKLPASERPGKVVFVVLTDGQENSSTKYTKADVLARITHQKEKYKWQFLFLGADADSFDEAQSIGVFYAQTMSWEPHRPGGIMRAVLASSNAVSDYRSNNTAEAVYSVQDRLNNNSK